MLHDRSSHRLSSFLRGRVVFNGGNSSMDCIVRDISPDGAKLQITNSVTVPDRFDLLIPQKGEIHRAKIAWRREDEVGVAFEQVHAQPSAVQTSSAVLDRLQELEDEVARLRQLMAEMQTQVREVSGRRA